MKLGLHLRQNSNGTYSFVGSVPIKLAFVTKAGNFVDEDEVTRQLRLPASYRTIKTRVFNSEDEAWLEARRLGAVK